MLLYNNPNLTQKNIKGIIIYKNKPKIQKNENCFAFDCCFILLYHNDVGAFRQS